MCSSHDFSHWQGIIGIRDMLVRQCKHCGLREIRILPPDVTPADTRTRDTFWMWTTEDEAADTRTRDTFWMWPTENGEEGE